MGPSSIDEPPPPIRRPKGVLWGVKDVPPGAIAFASFVVGFFFSCLDVLLICNIDVSTLFLGSVPPKRRHETHTLKSRLLGRHHKDQLDFANRQDKEWHLGFRCGKEAGAVSLNQGARLEGK